MEQYQIWSAVLMDTSWHSKKEREGGGGVGGVTICHAINQMQVHSQVI